MAGFFQNLLKDAAGVFFGNDYVRDYTHAAKTFRTNAYQYAPKLKFLFHVYFEINPAVYAKNVGQGANFGLDVKTVQLPKYTFETHTLNQYNRKRIVQTKIKYDPITITFHDDNGNIINDMWYNYYTYYYKDALKPGINSPATSSGAAGSAFYNSRNLYAPSITGNDDWGYIGESTTQNGTTSQASLGISKIPFFKNIQIFGFNQHNFVQYTLVNPIITNYQHDTYSYAEGSGTMENQMTIDYETVSYAEGAISGANPEKVPGFGMEANYDRTLSPIARPGSNATILGQGGLVETTSGVLQDLADGNFLSAIANAGRMSQTVKQAGGLKQIAKTEVNNAVSSAVASQTNARSAYYFPAYGTSPNNSAGVPTSGLSSPAPINNTGAGSPPGGQ
jgi:hypothetical protein